MPKSDNKLPITPITPATFEPRVSRDDPLDRIREDLRLPSLSSDEDRDGTCGSRRVPVGNLDEEGYDHIGERTFELKPADEIFDEINRGGLQGDLFGQGLRYED